MGFGADVDSEHTPLLLLSLCLCLEEKSFWRKLGDGDVEFGLFSVSALKPRGMAVGAITLLLLLLLVLVLVLLPESAAVKVVCPVAVELPLSGIGG